MIAPYDTPEEAARDAALMMIQAGFWTLVGAILSLLFFVTSCVNGSCKVVLGLVSLLLWVVMVAQRDLERAQRWIAARVEVTPGR